MTWELGELETGGRTYRYWQTGEGPALVVFHGGGGPDRAPAYAALGGGTRVLCFELPGFGQTPAGDEIATHRDLAAVMLSVIDAAGLERFALLGVSFGGAVAAWLATLAPERVERLVLVAPAALRHGEPLPGRMPEPIESVLRAHPERGGPEPLVQEDAERYSRFVRRVWGGSDDDALRAALSGLDLPTLIVFGTRDRLIPPETGREYKRLIPRATLALVYDAAHEVAWDRADAFTELVGDFVERGDAHVVAKASRVINP
jgi:4,5:9,10-diseco-3-hydroxy-5,9,17-trioxoandrosta-1(10),2-diene-4-oate hydrolase